MSDFIRFNENDAFLKRAVEVRSRMLLRLRRYFLEQGFLEVETPVVCSSPGVETHLAALETTVGSRRKYLTTSPEFHMKRLMAVGFDRIFQVTRAFRDGELGDLHNPEFTMVEWYRGDVDYGAIMADCEGLLAHLARGLCDDEGGPDVDLNPPYPRKTFETACRQGGLADPGSLSVEDRLLEFVDRVEPLLGVDGPEFLTEFPADQASLARLKPGDPRVAERFELYAAGLELANGFSELVDADEFLARCESDLAQRRGLGLPEYPVDQHYVTMLREGLPPCAGVALGFDRVVMLLTGASSIRQVLPFPLDKA